jgi:hypothetical protein
MRTSRIATVDVAVGRTPGAQGVIAEQQNSAPLLPFAERSHPANVGLSSAFPVR